MYQPICDIEELAHAFSSLLPAVPPFVSMLTFTVFFVVVFLALANKIGHFFTVIAHNKKDSSHRDVKRVFTAKEKNSISRVCGHRCEGTGLFLRCRYTGTDLHGDHWFPHSKGGATTTDNLVMLCPTCNRKKSDAIPTLLQTKALGWRRKHHHSYKAQLPAPGKWLPRGYSNGEEKDSILRMQRPYF